MINSKASAISRNDLRNVEEKQGNYFHLYLLLLQIYQTKAFAYSTAQSQIKSTFLLKLYHTVVKLKSCFLERSYFHSLLVVCQFVASVQIC